MLNQIDDLQAKLSGYLPKVVDLKATIEEINQRGEREKKQSEELLRQTAEKLKEQERKDKEREEEEKKKEREKEAATDKAAAETSKAEGGSAKGGVSSNGGGGDKGKGTTVSEESKAADCKFHCTHCKLLSLSH